MYEELARIFSEENNQSAQRELLMKEGTAKVKTIPHKKQKTKLNLEMFVVKNSSLRKLLERMTNKCKRSFKNKLAIRM